MCKYQGGTITQDAFLSKKKKIKKFRAKKDIGNSVPPSLSFSKGLYVNIYTHTHTHLFESMHKQPQELALNQLTVAARWEELREGWEEGTVCTEYVDSV